MAVEPTHEAARSTAQAVAHHGAQAVQEAAHGGDAIPELPNLVTVLHHRLQDAPWVTWLHQWENIVFAAFVGVLLALLAWRTTRHPATIPRGWQNLLEVFVEGIDGMVHGMAGRHGRTFTPFVATIFVYIWLMNLSVVVPFLKSSTSSINTTVALALVVFSYVQYTGLRTLGVRGYLDHLAGSPRDLVGWLLVPLMLPIHLLGELIKPMSLSMRLAFNVFAEDVLLAVLVGLGIGLSLTVQLPPWAPVPLQLFVMPLVLIFSTVQALVFSLLSTVYLSLMLPHEEHH